MRLVLDCSVAPGFVFEEERTAYTEAVEAALEKQCQLLVPPLFYCEFSNVLRSQERRGRWGREEVDACIDVMNQLPLLTIPVANAPSEMAPLLALAREHDLTAYDAMYLLLAHQQEAPIATQDKALVKAAKASNCYFEG